MITLALMLGGIAPQPAPAPAEDARECRRIIVAGETGTLIKRDSGETLCLDKKEWNRVERSQVRLARKVDAR